MRGEALAAASVIRFSIPIKTLSPNAVKGNTRLAAIIRAGQKKKEREAARLCFIAAGGKDLVLNDWMKPQVRLTRVSAGKLDGDNLASSLKAIRDGLADSLGIDDGSEYVTWTYDQRKCKRGEHSVDVEIA